MPRSPNDAGTLAKLALCELHQQRADAALETIRRAISLAPEAAHLHALKAFIEVDLRKPADALKSAEAALALDPECDDAFVAQASAHIHRNEWAKAEASARAALEINPDHAGGRESARPRSSLAEPGSTKAAIKSPTCSRRTPRMRTLMSPQAGPPCSVARREQAESHFLEALRLDAGNEAAREGLKEAFRAKSPSIGPT